MISAAITDHPDTLTDYHALKHIRRGSKQAIEDKAIEAYHKALDEGRSKEEAEEEYFKHFNNSHGQQEHTGVSGSRKRVTI
jgi:hypothetical protein